MANGSTNLLRLDFPDLRQWPVSRLSNYRQGNETQGPSYLVEWELTCMTLDDLCTVDSHGDPLLFYAYHLELDPLPVNLREFGNYYTV